MGKIVVTFGLIAGAILSAMMLLVQPFQDQIGMDRGVVIGYTSMVLAFLMVFVGVRTYRDNVAGGQVSFGRALLVGLAITAVATACYVATWQLIYYRITPDFAEKYAAHVIDKVTRAGASAAEIAERTREMAAFSARYRNPLFNIAVTALEPLPVGLLFTLVTAAVVSRTSSAERPATA